MWLGPPDMNKKMTAFALALSGIGGGLGASGFMLLVAARRASCCSIAPTASAPNPPKASVRNSLRLRVMRICSGIALVHVQKSVQIENRQRKLPPWLRLQK